MKTLLSAAVVLFLIFCLSACDQRMARQPKYEALESSSLFANNQAARFPPENTVAMDDPPVKGQPPQEVSLLDLQRGRERYEIFCVPCHGKLGYGDGPVVDHGFPVPPSYHSPKLREATLRHFYQVISEGTGIMYSYANRVPPQDRWRIALYIRALQQSQINKGALLSKQKTDERAIKKPDEKKKEGI